MLAIATPADSSYQRFIGKREAYGAAEAVPGSFCHSLLPLAFVVSADVIRRRAYSQTLDGRHGTGRVADLRALTYPIDRRLEIKREPSSRID